MVARKNLILIGWIGIFNRNKELKSLALNNTDFGSDLKKSTKLFDIWNNKNVKKLIFNVNANAVVFMKY